MDSAQLPNAAKLEWFDSDPIVNGRGNLVFTRASHRIPALCQHRRQRRTLAGERRISILRSAVTPTTVAISDRGFALAAARPRRTTARADRVAPTKVSTDPDRWNHAQSLERRLQ
jgi:hypothetical protein